MIFGHQNDDNAQPVAAAGDDQAAVAGVNPLAVDPATGASLPAVPEELEHPSTPEPSTEVEPTPAPEPAPQPEAPAPAPRQADDDVLHPGENDDLLKLKQEALSQLSPLVDHLDQTPEEKFRTTMMMIQSTDNQALLPDAYSAAQAITDEKVRAQALLDIVNEINYFTQNHND